MLKLGVRGTMNLIMLVNKNAIAAGAWGSSRPTKFTGSLHLHLVPLVFIRKEGSGEENV